MRDKLIATINKFVDENQHLGAGGIADAILNDFIVKDDAVTDFNKGVIYACAELVRNWDRPSMAQEILDAGVDVNYLDGVAEDDLDVLKEAGCKI